MNIIGVNFIVQLRGDGIGFRNLLGFESFTFQHIEKIGIATKVQLISPFQFDATVRGKTWLGHGAQS